MLNEYRQQINEIDAKLKELFLERLEIAKNIALHKKQNSLPILDELRERELMFNVAGDDKFLRQYFREIINISKNAQISLLLGQSIVLIGMMGTGKTTVGRRLASQLSLPFIDIDKQIQETAGMTTPEIFEKYGEDEFRRLESEAIKSLSKDEIAVISTGGGTVQNPENMQLLKKGSIIFFLNRPPRAIAVSLRMETRPLLQSRADIFNIYNERLPLYKKYADYTVYGNYTPDSAISIIINTLITRAM